MWTRGLAVCTPGLPVLACSSCESLLLRSPLDLRPMERPLSMRGGAVREPLPEAEEPPEPSGEGRGTGSAAKTGMEGGWDTEGLQPDKDCQAGRDERVAIVAIIRSGNRKPDPWTFQVGGKKLPSA